MIFVRYGSNELKRVADLTDLFAGRTALLVGGAPGLKTQPLNLLAGRGVLTMAINNAGTYFQPTLWCGVDRPECYEPQLLLDPKIMKFGNIAHAERQLDARYGGLRYNRMPNIYYFLPEANVPHEELLTTRRGLPWRNSSLFASICVLYNLGVRRIILAGSDFAVDEGGAMYANGATLSPAETRWNMNLYEDQASELRQLKQTFDNAGLELRDCSSRSRIGQVYETCSMERAVELCLEGFPAKPLPAGDLPHCSKFAEQSLLKRVASWPGYCMTGATTDQTRDGRENQRIVVM